MADIQSKGDMTVRKAGQKGGEKTAETHGREFYQEIGKKGGAKTSETHGPEFYQRIGQKGGEIGGHKGGQKVKDLIEAGKQAEGKSSNEE